jgi:hypothetical protein
MGLSWGFVSAGRGVLDMTSRTGACVWCTSTTSTKLNVEEGPRQVGRHGDADTYPT